MVIVFRTYLIHVRIEIQKNKYHNIRWTWQSCICRVNVCIDFWQINIVQQPHDRLINLLQIVSKLKTINYTGSHFQFRKGNIIKFALRKQRRAQMFCKHWLTFSRKDHVGLDVLSKTVQMLISEQEQVYRTNITAIEHTLVWPFTYNGYTFQLV